MTLRKKIVHVNPICSFNSDWLAPIVNQYLDFEPWDPDRTYPKNTLFYMNWLDFNDSTASDFCQQRVSDGFRVVIDNLWEVNPGAIPNTHRICCDRWFWYNESLQLAAMGYNQYRPESTPTKLALMPMRMEKPHRTELLEHLPSSLLDRMIWSYVAQGRQLPNDRDMADCNTQRYMNPEWYNSTYLSLVVETNVRPGTKYTPIFITEKTTKPLAFCHPFIVYGNRGTLRSIKSWGFETFSNLWDESYDEIQDYTQRKHCIIHLLNTITPVPHDAETQKRLQHNHALFFDLALVRDRIVKEILEPIIHYAETP